MTPNARAGGSRYARPPEKVPAPLRGALARCRPARVRAGMLAALVLAVLAACATVGAVPADAPVSPRGAVRLVVVSDLNSAYGSTEYEPEVHRAVELIVERWRPDLVIAAGDLIAGQRPSLGDERVREMWAAFEAVVGRPLRNAGIPFAPTLGNHDGSAYPAHRRDRRLALEHWREPGRDAGLRIVDRGEFPVYYSVEHGGVFVLVWDASNEATAAREAMMEWVRSQLASPAARAARHRLVLGHLPLYAVAEGRNHRGEVLAEADALLALLRRQGVDFYVSGHHHAYYPGCRDGLRLLHAGALGQGARPLLGSDRAPVQTVTLLDFVGADSVAITTYAFESGADTAEATPGGRGTEPAAGNAGDPGHGEAKPMRRIRVEELPARIDGFNGAVTRIDRCEAVEDEDPASALR